MAFFWNGQVFEWGRNHPAYQEAWGLDQSRIQIQVKVPWDERFQARDALLGTAHVAIAAGGEKYISRTTPHNLGFELEGQNLYAKAVTNVTGDVLDGSDPGGPPRFEKAVLTVLYEGLTYDIKEDAEIAIAGFPDESYLTRYVTKREVQSAQFLATQRGDWVWAEGPHGPGMGPGTPHAVFNTLPYRIPRAEIQWIWHQVPKEAIPRLVYAEMVGKTNDAPFDNDLYATETLEFLGASPEPIILPQEITPRAFNITVRALHYPKGINKFPDPADNQNFYRIMSKSGLAPVFELDDFRKLFRPPA